MLQKFLKAILDFFKPKIVKTVEDLQANKAANLELIGAAGAQEGNACVNFVFAYVEKEIPAVDGVLEEFKPEAEAMVQGLIESGVTDSGKIYDEVVAFLVKEEQYL